MLTFSKNPKVDISFILVEFRKNSSFVIAAAKWLLTTSDHVFILEIA